jgi:hypothetical protein
MPPARRALLDSPAPPRPPAIYNKAAADLTVLLRSADKGRMWNRPLALASGGKTYRLRFAKGTRDGNYDPDWFTSFTPASEVDMDSVKNRNRQDGIGGALVGVRKTRSAGTVLNPRSASPRRSPPCSISRAAT